MYKNNKDFLNGLMFFIMYSFGGGNSVNTNPGYATSILVFKFALSSSGIKSPMNVFLEIWILCHYFILVECL